MRRFVQFSIIAQFKKREKHPWGNVTFSIVFVGTPSFEMVIFLAEIVVVCGKEFL